MTATTEPIAALADKIRAKRQLPPPAMRRALRVAAKASTRDVAAACGVSHASIVNWEAGRRTPRGAHLEAYLRVLDMLRAEVDRDQPARAS